MKTGELKILLADDHSIIREGLIKTLASTLPDATCDEAANASEALRLILTNSYDLVILDISLPGRNGLEVLKEVRLISPQLPVIIFSMFPEDQFALRSIKAGASAYLTKDISSKELSDAIKKVLRGEKYFTSSLVDLITDDLRNNHSMVSHEKLSDREFQVFLLIASGKNVSSIADELSLSVKTISVYRSGILKKMNLKNNAEITHYAFKHKLVE